MDIENAEEDPSSTRNAYSRREDSAVEASESKGSRYKDTLNQACHSLCRSVT